MSKHFKKAILVFAALVLLAMPSIVFGENPADDPYGISQTAQQVNIKNSSRPILPYSVAGQYTVPEIVGAVVSVGLSLIGIVFFGLALYAGFKWMIAMGKSEDVEKAKETLEHAVIGLGIVLAAYAISAFVFSKLAPQSSVSSAPITPPPLQINTSPQDLQAAKCATNKCGKGCSSLCSIGEKCLADEDCELGMKCDANFTCM